MLIAHLIPRYRDMGFRLEVFLTHALAACRGQPVRELVSCPLLGGFWLRLAVVGSVGVEGYGAIS